MAVRQRVQTCKSGPRLGQGSHGSSLTAHDLLPPLEPDSRLVNCASWSVISGYSPSCAQSASIRDLTPSQDRGIAGGVAQERLLGV